MTTTAATTTARQPLRLRIHLPASTKPTPPVTELFELRAAVQPKPPVASKPHATVKVGSIELPIYKDQDGRFTLAWYEGRTRKRTRRATLADAKELAQQKAKDMADGKIYMANMTQAQRATLERVVEILHPTGKSPELAAAEYAGAQLKLKFANLQISIEAVVDDYISRQSRTKIVPIACPELADQFVQAKRSNTFGEKHSGAKWVGLLEKQAKRFKAYFNCPVNQLTSDTLKTWLNSIPGSPYTRKGYRTFVSGMVSYAKANHFLPEDWKELKSVPVPKTKTRRIKKALLKPEDMAKLLHVTQCTGWSDKMIPFMVCGAFAGVRHEEMNPEDPAKVPLDWSDITSQYIRIGPDTAKNPGDERHIKMPANLIAWLAPYRRRSGPVCTTPNTSNALTRIKKRAKLPFKKMESRNVLRKSWETYSSAVRDDAKGIAEEAGHSQAVGRLHYIQATYQEQAANWFSIHPPETEGVLPLDFRASA